MSEAKYNFMTKLHLVCSDNNLRPVFNCVHFTCGFAYASNGIAVIKQSLEIHSVLEAEKLEGKAIHRDSYKAIMLFDMATANDEGIECLNADGNSAFFPYFDMKGQSTPDFEKVMTRKPIEAVMFIGFTPKMLEVIMKAMYMPQGQIRMQFSGISNPIVCDCPGVDDQVAIIMPALIEPTIF